MFYLSCRFAQNYYLTYHISCLRTYSFLGGAMTQLDSSKQWFNNIIQSSLRSRLQHIKYIISDIDGSITSGLFTFTLFNIPQRWFSAQDAFALRYLLTYTDIKLAFISAGKQTRTTSSFIHYFNISKNLCFFDASDKRQAVQKLHADAHWDFDRMLIYGDDHSEAIIKLTYPETLFACPENAPFYIKPQSDFIIPKTGATHSFRLLLDLILYAHNKHFAQSLIEKELTFEKPLPAELV